MRKIELYQCEVCHTQFNDKTKAEECEKSHCKIESVAPKKWRAKEAYPDKVVVTFSDGKEIHYERE